MGMTMTQKILAKHAKLNEVKKGQLIEADLDVVLGNDITSPVAIREFEKLGIEDDELVRISSRRGSVITRATVTDRVKEGATYMTYQWWVGACNELTIANLDPISKTPEYKYCAVKLEKLEDQELAEKCVREEYQSLKDKMTATNI